MSHARTDTYCTVQYSTVQYWNNDSDSGTVARNEGDHANDVSQNSVEQSGIIYWLRIVASRIELVFGGKCRKDRWRMSRLGSSRRINHGNMRR